MVSGQWSVISGQWSVVSDWIDNEMKKIIERMVKQEIRDILAENEVSIRGIVEASLVSELRATIRESVCKALEDLTEEPSENKETRQPMEPMEGDGGAREPEIYPRPDLGARTPELGNPQSAIRNPQSAMGRYLYCVVEAGEKMSFGKIGIEGNEVYTIPYEELSTVVHNCPAEPYKSEDKEIMKNWIMVHQSVIDQALERFGTVLPLGFDTIIQGNETTSPEENMKNWLKQDYDNLKRKIEKISGKAEYGVQVFWDPKIIAKNVIEESPEIKKLNEEIRSKPKGIAYMYKQKLEDLVKKEMEGKADQDFKEFFERIKPYADDLKVEKTKKAEDERQMLMNLSCLLPKEASKKLGDELEKISNMEGYSVRFTGPWPPYSFV